MIRLRGRLVAVGVLAAAMVGALVGAPPAAASNEEIQISDVYWRTGVVAGAPVGVDVTYEFHEGRSTVTTTTTTFRGFTAQNTGRCSYSVSNGLSFGSASTYTLYSRNGLVSSIDSCSWEQVGSDAVLTIALRAATYLAFNDQVQVRVQPVDLLAPSVAGPAVISVGMSNFPTDATNSSQTVTPAPPALTTVEPDVGPRTGGTVVSLRGVNLDGASSVTFGRVPGVIVNAVSDDLVIVQTASNPGTGNPLGPVDVVVTVAGGTATKVGGYTFQEDTPGVLSVTPSCDVVAGTSLRIDGVRLDQATVTIGGQPAPIVTAASGPMFDSMTVTAPPSAAGKQAVVISTPAGRTDGTRTVTYGPCSPMPQPFIGSVVTTPVGGFATVNWTLAGDITNAAGLQYSVNGSGWVDLPWTPQNGAKGVFTLSGLTQKDRNKLQLAVVNKDPSGKQPVATTFFSFTTSPTPLPASTGNAGSVAVRPSTTPPGGSAAQPVGGTGATAGGPTSTAGAPCNSESGPLYPPIFGTLGSGLVMAPNPVKQPTGFVAVGGALPPGMILDRLFGVIYGVPTAAGKYSLTVKATFSDAATITEKVALTIDNDVQTLAYPTAFGGPIGQSLTMGPTTNAPAGSTYAIVCGTLPAGLTFDSKTGIIQGTPTVEDTQQLRVVETNKDGQAAASFLLLSFPGAARPALAYPAHPHPRAHARARIRPAISGASSLTHFTVIRGKLPRGLRITHRTGLITGKAARHTSRPHRITVAGYLADGSLVVAAPMSLTVRRHR